VAVLRIIKLNNAAKKAKIALSVIDRNIMNTIKVISINFEKSYKI
jgi:hypothetical protein